MNMAITRSINDEEDLPAGIRIPVLLREIFSSSVNKSMFSGMATSS